MKAKRWLIASVMVLGGSLLGGCVVAPQPYYASEPVLVAPPPPRVEIVGVAPFPGAVWIDGYWGWSGRRHEWVPGRWESPRPGYGWVSPRWERQGPHWRERRGYWNRH